MMTSHNRSTQSQVDPALEFSRSLAASLALMIVYTAGHVSAQSLDEDVFQTQTPPNVVLFVDNSNSMDNPIYHTAYDEGNIPASFYTCDPFALPGPSATILSGANSNGRFRGNIQDENGDELYVQCNNNRAR